MLFAHAQEEYEAQLQALQSSLISASHSAKGIDSNLAAATVHAAALTSSLEDIRQWLKPHEQVQHGQPSGSAPNTAEVLQLCTTAQDTITSLTSLLHQAAQQSQGLQRVTRAAKQDPAGGPAEMSSQEAQLLQEIGAARDVFKLVEREVSILQHQASLAAARLRASERETQAARQALQSAISQLQSASVTDSKAAGGARESVQQVSPQSFSCCTQFSSGRS